MATIAPMASRLLAHCGIDMIPTNHAFVDCETVLKYFQNTTPSARFPCDTIITSGSGIVKITPTSECRIRPYQGEVIDQVFSNATIRPSLVIMPCGSGKTFTALCILSRIKRRSLIVTNYKVVANQWKRELLKYFDVTIDKVQCIGDNTFNFDLHNIPDFTIITYDAFVSLSTPCSRSLVAKLLLADFAVVVLDESHKAVSKRYFCMLARMKSTFLALTATPVREDSEINMLFQLVRDTITIPSTLLIEAGYISDVRCTTVFVPTHPALVDKELTHWERVIASVLNPNKFAYLQKLLVDMMFQKDKVIIFCDDVFSLLCTCEKLVATFPVIGPITMKSDIQFREICISKFVCDVDGSILMMSRTGDEGLDVPCATKIIQICTPWGSRRQHAQRIGRVQRKTETNSVCEAITLVSDSTPEYTFSVRRDTYLRFLGYTVSIIHCPQTHEFDFANLINTIKARPKNYKSGDKRPNHTSEL